MNNFLKAVALLVAIACSVWVAVLWRWQITARDMSVQDIAAYLVLLPLVVFGFALALRWAWRGAVARHALRASGATPIGVGAASAVPVARSADEAHRGDTSQLLGAFLACAAGESAGDLLSAAKSGAPRPSLDPELRDAAGLPVFAARMLDLLPSSLAPWFEPGLGAARGQREEWATAEAPEHVLRALAALQEPLTDALRTLTPWAARFESAADAPRGGLPPCRVRLLLGWPFDWTAFEQALGMAAVRHLVADAAAAPIAAECFVVTAHVGSGEELLLHADRLMQSLARDAHSEPVIVAACHSAIGEAAVGALEREGTLYSSDRRPKGRMPGEGAAALVLAPADWPVDPEADGPACHLHRPAVMRRDKSVDAPGRVGSDIAVQSMTQALVASGLEAERIAAVVCDADQHTARTAEFHVGGIALFSTLDSGDDMHLIGTVTGGVGPVSALMVVACAAELAKKLEKPCLAATFGDLYARLALVALPGAPAPKSPPAAGAIHAAAKYDAA